jgi:cation transport regulator ChaC
MRDPTDLRSQESDQTDQQRRDELKQQREIEDLKWLLAHPQGRRIAWRWMGEAGVFRGTFNQSGSVMAFNEGKRAQGLALLMQIMAHAPDAFTKMQKEAKADEH